MRGRKRGKDEVKFKTEIAQEKSRTRLKSKTELNKTESLRRRQFFEAIRDGPIYSCVCCRRIRFKKQVCIFEEDKIIEKSSSPIIIEKAIGNPPDNMKVKGNHYICTVCNQTVSKWRIPAMSNKNNLDIVDFVDLDGNIIHLTEMENALIAKNILFQMFVQLPKSRWTATRKQIVSVPVFDQDIINTINSLPRTPSEGGIVKVQLKRKKSMKNTHMEKYISIPKILKALSTLKRLGNKHYESVQFDTSIKEKWKTEDPDGYEMVFGNDGKKDEEDVVDPDDINDNEESDDDDDDATINYMKEDAIQKWKFDFASTTTFINDYPELDVKETCSQNDNDPLNDPIIVALVKEKFPQIF